MGATLCFWREHGHERCLTARGSLSLIVQGSRLGCFSRMLGRRTDQTSHLMSEWSTHLFALVDRGDVQLCFISSNDDRRSSKGPRLYTSLVHGRDNRSTLFHRDFEVVATSPCRRNRCSGFIVRPTDRMPSLSHSPSKVPTDASARSVRHPSRAATVVRNSCSPSTIPRTTIRAKTAAAISSQRVAARAVLVSMILKT